jgi:type II secretory pathway component GspD/PulD (secretin)
VLILTKTMNKQIKLFWGFAILGILWLTVPLTFAEEGDDTTKPDGIPQIFKLGPIRLTDEHLIVSIQATAPIKYREPAIQKARRGIPTLVYVDMPNTLNAVDPEKIGNSVIRVELADLFTEPVELPIRKVVLSQFRRTPPICRIVFHSEQVERSDIPSIGAIKPTVVAGGNELRFEFALSSPPKSIPRQLPVRDISKQPPEPPKPEMTKPPDTKETKRLEKAGLLPPSTKATETETPTPTPQPPTPTPRSQPPSLKPQTATLSSISTMFIKEPKLQHTRVRLSADAPLTVERVTWATRSEDVTGAILDVHLANTKVSDALRRKTANDPLIRQIALTPVTGTPPHCTIHIHLTRRAPYTIDSRAAIQRTETGEETHALDIRFEIPLLERIVTIKSENESLQNLLFILFRQQGTNFIADKDVTLTNTVTFYLVDVPLKVALDQILNSRDYGYVEDEKSGILRIRTIKAIESETGVGTKKPDVIEPPKELVAKSYQLQYASVVTISAALDSLKSKEDGKIITDENTRSIIIIDTKAHFAEIEGTLRQVLQTLDRPPEIPPSSGATGTTSTTPTSPPTVTLIQRVIRLNYADPERLKQILTPYLTQPNIGSIEAFTAGASGSAGGGGTAGESSRGAPGSGGLGQAVGRGGYLVIVDTPDRVAVMEQTVAELDVPIPQVEIQVHIVESTVSRGIDTGVQMTGVDKERDTTFSMTEGGGGQIQIGTLTTAQFEAVLRAVATESDTRLLANPHITVMENQTAQFHSGEEVPFRQITIDQGVQQITSEFKNVGILLEVMAQVKTDNRISLLVSAQVSSLGERPPGGEPAINTRNANTQMLIPDSDTVVIGGLTTERTIETINKVPILGSIPLLGGLFRSRQEAKSQSEITIYLTPHIVRE